MTPFHQPRFARGSQLIKMLAEANAAGFRCVKLECLKGAMYRAHFAEEKNLKESYGQEPNSSLTVAANETSNA